MIAALPPPRRRHHRKGDPRFGWASNSEVGPAKQRVGPFKVTPLPGPASPVGRRHNCIPFNFESGALNLGRGSSAQNLALAHLVFGNELPSKIREAMTLNPSVLPKCRAFAEQGLSGWGSTGTPAPYASFCFTGDRSPHTVGKSPVLSVANATRCSMDATIWNSHYWIVSATF